jgi:hypothetical protein
MPTTRWGARYLARMFCLMAFGFGLLVVGLLLDTPPCREAQPIPEAT